MDGLYIGVLSGTSADGIDTALVRFSANRCRVEAARATPWPDRLRDQILHLTHGGAVTLQALGELDAEVGEAFADAILALLHEAAIDPSEVRAVGSHGQTLFHQPTGRVRFTTQIGDPNRIAERTGITTVADLRRRDMAAGGQGAPLAPAFHAAHFGAPGETRAVANIGGIANLTVIPADRTNPVIGFDTGPGNGLLDAWAARHLGTPYDHDGAWAEGGAVIPEALAELLADPFFALPPPKSTGRETFHLDWLQARLGGRGGTPQDIQATLAALTVEGIARALEGSAPECHRLFLCGGGVHNADLVRRLAARVPGVAVASTAALGINPDFVEAAAFAWLARQTLNGLPGNLPSVTGARRAAVLGAIYPANQAGILV